ncbi:MAG TPA: MBL fold metallo-hydrolase [Nitrososphaeraceae archaeon]|jgi:glyoxylase-like metal-dependent hydrolase (beta-lactamase superfamily II)
MNNIDYTQKIIRRITSGACLIILLISACNAAINGSILPVQTSKALAAVQDNKDNVETVSLKFVSQALKESNANTTGNSSSNSNNKSSISSTTQVPEAAKGPTIPAKGYLVQQIRDHLYWVTDGSYNTMFLVTDKGVVAVDAPPTIGKNYLKAIAEVTNKPVTYVIYSHAHLDHIGAAGMFPRNATFIAQQETAAELQRARSVAMNASTVPPIPTVTFAKNYTLQIGNQTLKLDYYGVNHLPGNIFIYAPNQKVLMLVDIIFPGWIPFPYLAIAKDTAGFIKAHDIALNNYDFDTLVGGHLTRLGTRNDVIVQKEFVSDLEKAAAQANQQVSFGDIAKQVGGGGGQPNPWLMFSKYIDAINENCVNSMLPKWENRLGGAQQFMSTHCFTMTESGRVDPTMHELLQNSTLVNK